MMVHDDGRKGIVIVMSKAQCSLDAGKTVKEKYVHAMSRQIRQPHPCTQSRPSHIIIFVMCRRVESASTQRKPPALYTPCCSVSGGMFARISLGFRYPIEL